jgi:hypothetical protein
MAELKRRSPHPSHALRVKRRALRFHSPRLRLRQAGKEGAEDFRGKALARNWRYQICERSQRQDSRPTFQARGELFVEILAVPVIPSRRLPSGLGNSTTTAK